MAIKPIRPLYSPSATATNGSDTITVTGNVDCSYIYDGFLVALGTRQVVEAVRGTSPDGSGNSTITLRRNWDAANTTAPLLGWNSIEGLPAAVNQLRQIIGDSQDINDQLLPLANLMGSGIIRKTGTETYELLADTSAGRAILQASDATAQRVALGLGTAATRNVTTSATDTTADRLLKVADFGLGSNGYRAYPVTNLNSPENSDVPVGLYSFNTTFDNGPENSTGVIIVATRASGEKLNILMTGGTSTPNMYFRRVTGSNIGDWQQIYHTNNIVGTVSQSSGVPTGAVIERGSNSDGEYVKFADGTLICTRTAAIPDSNAAQSFSYPATFTGAISVSLCGASGEIDGLGFAERRRALFITIVSADSSGWRLARDSNTIDLGLAVSGFSARLTAVGRWY